MGLNLKLSFPVSIDGKQFDATLQIPSFRVDLVQSGQQLTGSTGQTSNTSNGGSVTGTQQQAQNLTGAISTSSSQSTGAGLVSQTTLSGSQGSNVTSSDGGQVTSTQTPPVNPSATTLTGATCGMTFKSVGGAVTDPELEMNPANPFSLDNDHFMRIQRKTPVEWRATRATGTTLPPLARTKQAILSRFWLNVPKREIDVTSVAELNMCPLFIDPQPGDCIWLVAPERSNWFEYNVRWGFTGRGNRTDRIMFLGIPNSDGDPPVLNCGGYGPSPKAADALFMGENPQYPKLDAAHFPFESSGAITARKSPYRNYQPGFITMAQIHIKGYQNVNSKKKQYTQSDGTIQTSQFMTAAIVLYEGEDFQLFACKIEKCGIGIHQQAKGESQISQWHKVEIRGCVFMDMGTNNTVTDHALYLQGDRGWTDGNFFDEPIRGWCMQVTTAAPSTVYSATIDGQTVSVTSSDTASAATIAVQFVNAINTHPVLSSTILASIDVSLAGSLVNMTSLIHQRPVLTNLSSGLKSYIPFTGNAIKNRGALPIHRDDTILRNRARAVEFPGFQDQNKKSATDFGSAWLPWAKHSYIIGGDHDLGSVTGYLLGNDVGARQEGGSTRLPVYSGDSETNRVEHQVETVLSRINSNVLLYDVTGDTSLDANKFALVEPYTVDARLKIDSDCQINVYKRRQDARVCLIKYAGQVTIEDNGLQINWDDRVLPANRVLFDTYADVPLDLATGLPSTYTITKNAPLNDPLLPYIK